MKILVDYHGIYVGLAFSFVYGFVTLHLGVVSWLGFKNATGHLQSHLGQLLSARNRFDFGFLRPHVLS